MVEREFDPDIFSSGAALCQPFVDEFDVSGASISVFVQGDRQATIGATGLLAARAEALQFDLSEGPHWEAVATRLPVICGDLTSVDVTAKWPLFLNAVSGLGINALFAIPMKMGAAIVGVVDLYCTHPMRLDARAITRASGMADRTAGPAVRRALRSARDHDSAEGILAPALRREVHQATGMVLSQLGISATDAFARLQAHAFATGQSVEHVAADIVHRKLFLTE